MPWETWSLHNYGKKSELICQTLKTKFRNGKFDGLLGWLRTNIHQHGKKFEPQELVQRITGSKITPEPYMRYLNKKFGEVYNL